MPKTKSIDKDDQLYNIFNATGDEIFNMTIASNFKFNKSNVEDIKNLALNDFNKIMNVVTDGKWHNLKSKHYELRLGKLQYGQTGLYYKFKEHFYQRKNTNKIILDIENIKNGKGSIYGQSGKVNPNQMSNDLVIDTYTTLMHEIFHSIEENKFKIHRKEKKLLRGGNTDIFSEGAGRFIEVYIRSILEIKNPNHNNWKDLTKDEFLKNFINFDISKIVNQIPDKSNSNFRPKDVYRDIKSKISNLSPYDQGLFLFSINYIDSESFSDTLKKIYRFGRKHKTSRRYLYKKFLKENIKSNYNNIIKFRDEVQNSIKNNP